jgi:hypothetical protein
VRLRIGRIGKLIDEESAGRTRSDGFGEVLIIVGMAATDVRAREHHFGAHRLAVQNFLARHLVGHDEYDAVALTPTDQSKTKPRVASRRLDDGTAVR